MGVCLALGRGQALDADLVESFGERVGLVEALRRALGDVLWRGFVGGRSCMGGRRS